MFAPLGTLFIQLIKMLVIPLVALSIISGAASLGNSRSAGVIGGISIAFIMLTTVVAVLIAIAGGIVLAPGEGIDKETIASLTATNSVNPDGEAPTLPYQPYLPFPLYRRQW